MTTVRGWGWRSRRRSQHKRSAAGGGRDEAHGISTTAFDEFTNQFPCTTAVPGTWMYPVPSRPHPRLSPMTPDVMEAPAETAPWKLNPEGFEKVQPSTTKPAVGT